MEKKKNEASVMSPKTAGELLEMYFLDARSHMLEIAAILDRIERAGGGSDVMEDSSIKQLFDGCNILRDCKGNRAEEFLKLFTADAELYKKEIGNESH